MKFTDALKQQRSTPLISLEIIPPVRGGTADDIFHSIENLMDFNPEFVNVTNHQAHIIYGEVDGEMKPIPSNRRPGTIGLTAAIKNRFNVESVPHLICGGVDKYVVENMLIDLRHIGVENIFVIRGDALPGTRQFVPESEGYSHASDMVKQISDMNKGTYVIPTKDPQNTDFCVGVAGYPEKHFEALNLEKDLEYLKRKVEQGADYIITQMFFGFDYYKNFVEKAREIGITIPIIPGIKPIVKEKFLKTIPRAFYINVPPELVKAFESARTPEEEFTAGTKYMADVLEKLIDFGVPCLHVFTLGEGDASHALLKAVLGKNNSAPSDATVTHTKKPAPKIAPALQPLKEVAV